MLEAIGVAGHTFSILFAAWFAWYRFNVARKPTSYISSPSTRFVSKMVRVPAPPEGPPAALPPEGRPSLSSRNPREPLTLTVKYRGGAEAWFEVRARGHVWRRAGHVQLIDLMRDINEGRYLSE